MHLSNFIGHDRKENRKKIGLQSSSIYNLCIFLYKKIHVIRFTI